MQAVIMAGGRGERLRPITDDKPKALVEVSGKPMLERISDNILSNDIRKIHISVRYFGEQIIEAYKHRSEFMFHHEAKARGTAGSLGDIALENDDPVLVHNCDVLTDLDLLAMIEFHKLRNSKITAAVVDIERQCAYGAVDVREKDGLINDIQEKPVDVTTVLAGIYILSNDVIKSLPPRRRFDITEVLKVWKGCHAYKITGKWIDVGTPDKLKKAEEMFGD